MEDPQVQAYNSSLDKVLKNYQTVAMSSLGGPSSFRPSWPETSLSGKQLVEAMSMKEAAVRVSASKSAASSAVEQAVHRSMASASGVKIMEYDPLLHPPPFPIQQMPVFTPLDQTKSEKGITILEGEAISCFAVGGERRLCLPQILNSVLREFSLQQINAVCDELHIYCSRCNPEQLEILKVTGILPYSAPSCGLITKTDAERLCNALVHGIIDTRSPKSIGATPAEEKPKHPTENTIKVYHECFGKCKGLLTPELYETEHSSCVECLECGAMLSPQKFIVHGHRRRETRTCHWGFDSDNWRSYLLLARDQNPEEKYNDILDRVKAKFDPTCQYKRKQVLHWPGHSQGVDENGNAKRIKLSDEDELSKDAIITSSWPGTTPLQRPSAFRPWSPSILNKEGKPGVLPDHGTVLVRDSRGMPTYLSMGPPVLVNPERVVPHTAASKFDSQFAPNVALAPPLKLSPSSKDSLSPDGEKDRDIKTEDLGEGTLDSMEHEIELVKSMLESDALDSRAGREKLLHELARIRVRQEERLQGALVAKRTLQQEMEFLRLTKKDKIREAMDAKRSLRKELDRVRIEYERKLRESNDSRQRLKRDLELARSRRHEKTNEMGRDNDRLVTENEYLRDRLREVEEERNQLRLELETYRRREKKEREGVKEEVEEKESKEEKEECPHPTTIKSEESTERKSGDEETKAQEKEKEKADRLRGTHNDSEAQDKVEAVEDASPSRSEKD